MATDYKKASDLIKKVRDIFSRGIENRFLLQADVIRLVEDQERIARNEERERCIKAACKEHCDWCMYNGVWHDKYDSDCQRCVETDELRKAMEGGEV